MSAMHPVFARDMQAFAYHECSEKMSNISLLRADGFLAGYQSLKIVATHICYVSKISNPYKKLGYFHHIGKVVRPQEVVVFWHICKFGNTLIFSMYLCISMKQRSKIL